MVMENQKQLFVVEAMELLQDLEDALMELENDPENQDTVQRVFRCMHTIKGSGAMFGFDAIANFTHHIESVYDAVRNGEIKVTKHLIDITLSACDQIKAMLDSGANEDSANEKKSEIMDAFFRLLPSKDTPEITKPSVPDDAVAEMESQTEKLIYLRFSPHENLFKTGNNPALLLEELTQLGLCRFVPRFSNIPDLEVIDPENCYLFWDILCKTTQDLNGLRDVFIFVEDDCDLHFEILSEDVSALSPEILDDLQSCIRESDDCSPENLATSLREKTTLQSKQSGTEQSKQTKDETSSKPQLLSSIRVASDKLDNLVDLAGELVIAKERLNQYVQLNPTSELIQITEEIDRFTANLRDTAMSMRLLPIGTLFSRFKRLIRDLAFEQGKEVELTTNGAETELDKTILEKLNDPLVHLIRNAVDHGIEPAPIRMISGKSKVSHIVLKAFQSGSNVVVQIEDDGKGLDQDAILTKAIEKGLISENGDLSEREIFELIFHPGFSTANQITEISGRGVGMDVVKRNIEELRGSISVKSVKNKGTTITLRLPLTLGIIEGLLVRVDENSYVLPLSTVEECLEINQKRNGERQQQIISIRDEAVPYVRLRDHFHVRSDLPAREQMLIIKMNDTRIGFVVDEIIGEHQIVIKNLGKMLNHVAGLSGATVLGDGSVALILDAQKLMELAEHEKGWIHE